MKIQNENNLKIKEYDTIADLDYGDVFVFLGGDYAKEIFIKANNGTVIRLYDGSALDEYDVNHCPVKEVKCALVIEETEE